MSNSSSGRRRRRRLIRAAEQQARAAMRCPDCDLGRHPAVWWDGRVMRVAVEHDHTCPAVPSAARARGHTMFVSPWTLP